MTTKKQTSKQVTISYRVDAFTSKISVQPALVSALTMILKNEGQDLTGEQWCSREAAKAKANGVKKVSAYVREKATIRVFPRAEMMDYEMDLGTKDIRYRIGESDKMTTLTVGAAILHYLNKISTDKGSSILKKLASHYHSFKTDDSHDVSHTVREMIVQGVISDRFAAPLAA